MASPPILPLAVWQSGTNQNSIPANDNALRLEALNREIISQAVTAQPASPADGDTYIIAATHTGAQWAGFTPKDIAIFKSGTWYAWAPVEGLVVNVAGSLFKYDSGAWASAGGGSAAWGAITGTLSAQTDLQAALDAKASTAYVDNLVQGLSWKKAVRAATTANGSLATAFENGDAIDGVTLATGDRILLKNQTTGSENGIYTVNASGAPTRATDADAGAELVNATVYVSEGSSLADTQWTCSTNAPITIGTTALTFVQLSGGAGFSNPMTTAGDIITGGASGAPQRLAAGSTGYVLTIVAGAPAWAAASGGGLTGYTVSLNTASPNATINTSQLLASGGSTDQDAAITPKGAGALLAQVPDSTAAGGNKRGNYAVDLQLLRALATQVASANYSTISGGQSNRASSAHTAIGGGLLNVASQSYAVVAGGWANTASGLYSGVTNGRDNVANGQQSRVGGSGGTARGIIGADIYGIVGGNQRGAYGLQRYTTNATQAVATVDYNATPDVANQIVLADNMAVTFSGYVVAKQSGSLNAKHWKFEGGIVRGSGAGTTALTAAVTPSVISAAAGASSWAVDIDADTTLGCLRIKVTGAAATNIAWTVVVEPTAEVVLA